MTLKTILQAAASTTSKTAMPRTKAPSSRATVYAYSLLSQSSRKQTACAAISLPSNVKTCNRNSGDEQRSYHASTKVQSSLPVIIQTTSDRSTIDPYLGNLLDGFCNGSCSDNTNLR